MNNIELKESNAARRFHRQVAIEKARDLQSYIIDSFGSRPEQRNERKALKLLAEIVHLFQKSH